MAVIFLFRYILHSFMGAVFWGMWSLPRGSDPRTH